MLPHRLTLGVQPAIHCRDQKGNRFIITDKQVHKTHCAVIHSEMSQLKKKKKKRINKKKKKKKTVDGSCCWMRFEVS